MGILDRVATTVINGVRHISSHRPSVPTIKPYLFRGKSVTPYQSPIHELVARTTDHVENDGMVWDSVKNAFTTLPQLDIRRGDGNYSQGQVTQAINLHIAQSVMWRHKQTREWFYNAKAPHHIDHFGIRTLDRDRTRFFLNAMGYFKQYPDLKFPQSALVGSGFTHATYGTTIPLYFVSEFDAKVGGFSDEMQEFANQLHASLPPLPDDLGKIALKLEQSQVLSEEEALTFVTYAKDHFKFNYKKIRKADYDALIEKRADALAWIATNGQYANHVAVRFNDEEEFRRVHGEMEKQYGTFIPIQSSPDGLIMQTANKATTWQYRDCDKRRLPVYGPFLEFVHRKINPKTDKLHDGFDVGNATAIFNHSTVINTPQVKQEAPAQPVNNLDEVD